MFKYKVCILLSTYNGEKYLIEQLESLLTQNEIDVFIIVRDDGSTDSTIDILNQYKERYPHKFQVIFGKNVGCEQSFFELLYNKEIYADYYAFCDQDDLWDRNKCITQIRLIENIEGSALAACNLMACNERLEPIRVVYSNEYINYYTNIIQHNDILRNFHGCTLLWNRELHFMFQAKRPTTNVAHDVWVNSVANSVGTVKIVNLPLVNYRLHGSNVSGFGLNFFEKFVNRCKMYYGKDHPQRDEISKNILELYKPYVKMDKYSILNDTMNYKKNFVHKFSFLKKCIFKTRKFPDSMFWAICVLIGKY